MSKIVGALKDTMYFSYMKKTFQVLENGILIGRDVLVVWRKRKQDTNLSEEQKKEIEDTFSGEKENQVFALQDVMNLFATKQVFTSGSKLEKQIRKELILGSESFQALTEEFQVTLNQLNSDVNWKWFTPTTSVVSGNITFLSHPIFWKKPVEVAAEVETGGEGAAAAAAGAGGDPAVIAEEEEEEDGIQHDDHSSLPEDPSEAIKQKENAQDTNVDDSSDSQNAQVEGEKERRLDTMEVPKYISLGQLQTLIGQWTQFERTVSRVAGEFKNLKQDEESNGEKIKIYLLFSNIIGNNLFSKKNPIWSTHFFKEWNEEFIRMNKEKEVFEKNKKAWKKDKNANPVPIEPKPLMLDWSEVTQLMFQEMIPQIPPNQSLEQIEKDQQQEKEREDSTSIISTNSKNGFISRLKKMFSSSSSELSTDANAEADPEKTQVPGNDSDASTAQMQQQEIQGQDSTLITYDDMEGNVLIPLGDVVRLIDEHNHMKALVSAMKEAQLDSCLPASVSSVFNKVSGIIDDEIITVDISPQSLTKFKETYGDSQSKEEMKLITTLSDKELLFQSSFQRLSMKHALQKNQSYGKNEFQIRSSKVSLPVAAVELSSSSSQVSP